MTKGIGRPSPHLRVGVAQRLTERGQDGLVLAGQENVPGTVRRGRPAHVAVGIEQDADDGVPAAFVPGDVVRHAKHDALPDQRVGVAQALDGLSGLVAAVRQQRSGNGLGERQFGPAEQFA